VIEAFLDESGTHRGSPILAVGACVGTHDQWAIFLESWNNLEFHAKNPIYDQLKPKLASAIRKSEIHGVVAFLRPEDWQNHTNIQTKSAIGNAYAVCAFACVEGICRNFSEPVSFVIEDGQPNSEWVERVIKSLAEDDQWKHCIGPVALAKKRDFVQLHSSDFLAHSWSTGNPWCGIRFHF
jgi:hypothetical protein